MTKLLVRIILSLIICALGEHGKAHAHTHVENFSYSFSRTSKFFDHIKSDNVRLKHWAIFKSGSHHKKKSNSEIDTTDEKEDDTLVPFNRCVESTNYFVDFFSTQVFGYLCESVRHRLLFCQGFSCLPEHTYLLLRVIRV